MASDTGAFDTLLVANRGEIACRVMRTARAMGLRTVAVYSEADRHARHVGLADTAVPIGAAPARDSYLNAPRLLDACRLSGAQAVHPGYGFLSENAGFARACREAGIVFVGPPPEAIEALGNKSAAKQLAERIGVPCLPGYCGADQDLDTLVDHARRVGAPLMIKAAAGGGGRGMRRCDDVGDAQAVRSLLEAARSEAQASFGDGDLLLERLVEEARHVEVQVFGDAHGHYLHLGERDCSTQRRNQKILEEAPAPGVSAALRACMGDAAVRLAREVGYLGAGTIEFLLGPDHAFHFLEMNTRLQVEHPVTEAVTGLDLVEWQLRVARGEPLPLAQQAIRWQGHAIEARLCAEDAFAGFVPQTGRIDAWHVPELDGVRLDHGLVARPEIPPHYDSMVAKLIAHGGDRAEALQRLRAALTGTSVLGVTTNRDYLLACLGAEPFMQARLSTRWLALASPAWQAPRPDARWLAAAAAVRLVRRSAQHGVLARWSSCASRTTPVRLSVAGDAHVLRLTYGADSPIRVQVGDAEVAVTIERDDGLACDLLVDGRVLPARALTTRTGGWLDAFGVCSAFEDLSDAAPDRSVRGASGTVASGMHGQLVRLAIGTGQRVERGEFLLAIEAMKMEHRIESPITGIVVEIGATVGTQVSPGRVLLRIEPEAAPVPAAEPPAAESPLNA